MNHGVRVYSELGRRGREPAVAYFIGLFWYIVEELSKIREACLRAKKKKPKAGFPEYVEGRNRNVDQWTVGSILHMTESERITRSM